MEKENGNPVKKRLFGRYLIVTLLVGIAVGAGAVYAAFQLQVKVPVRITIGLAALTNVVVNGSPCTIVSGGQTATCGEVVMEFTILPPPSALLTADVSGTPNFPVAVSSLSDNSALVTVTPSSSNPTQINSSGSAHFEFTISAVTPTPCSSLSCTANISVQISG